jgi:DNA-binding transcriptional LysR family regulator
MRPITVLELKAVVAIGRHRSFKAAAVELGISRTALSHAIATLEARLGIQLLHRTTRSVSPTVAGEQFVTSIGPALGDIGLALDAVNSHRDKPAGKLKLNLTVGAARQLLAPIVLDFLRRYPDMEIDLVTEGKLIDIVADGFDAGVRFAESVPQDMIAVPIGPPQRFAVVASPAYFAQHLKPKTPDDIRFHCCIKARMASGVVYRWEFERRGETIRIDVKGQITLDEFSLILTAALSGTGLAYLPEWDVLDAIKSGQLERVLEEWTPPFPGLCLYYPSRRRLSAGVRAFLDFIQEKRRATP